ncbi:ANTAR domain-containing protein [Kribbella sp. CA-293567]|uniref:ANTAR domain-containing protein n=1 Tax=Kribbella sp. CA-293567 TaxID=3002436 RepID=UPI0022DD645C|nr:ANTAR domain-containing protein [Kribbella sp. CA-293567]WBQ08316.1 ANTAR domain-containing protein [Kribbella sp. CA-293567]
MTDRAELFVRLATLAAANVTDAHLAGRLCDASRLILGADGAAITVENTSSSRTTLSTTDRVMATLEDLQDVTGEGPCLDAFRYSTYFTLALENEPNLRWPEFARSAWQAVGGLQMYSFPMRPGGETFGVISVYTTDGRELPEPIDAVQFVADAVGAALLRDPTAEGLGEGAWASRAQVHHACGMVTAQLGLPPDDALAILRAHAYAYNITLVETARQVVDRELTFGGEK